MRVGDLPRAIVRTVRHSVHRNSPLSRLRTQLFLIQAFPSSPGTAISALNNVITYCKKTLFFF